MSPLSRKVRLLELGITMTEIGRRMKPPVTAQQVSQVNSESRESPRVQAAIAEALGLTVEQAFPPRARSARRRRAVA